MHNLVQGLFSVHVFLIMKHLPFRNMEGETILEFQDTKDVIVCGMQFKKDDNKIVMYSLVRSNTRVDYPMIRKQDRKCICDVKAIPGEETPSDTGQYEGEACSESPEEEISTEEKGVEAE